MSSGWSASTTASYGLTIMLIQVVAHNLWDSGSRSGRGGHQITSQFLNRGGSWSSRTRSGLSTTSPGGSG
jgi:hypothetical protein